MANVYSMNDLKKGLRIELDGEPYKIVEYQHVKPGKGAAFVRCKIKSFITNRLIDKTFHAGDKCQEPDMQTKTMQYLYDDGEALQFMDTQNYEQLALSYENCKEAKKWLKDGLNVSVQFHNEKAICVDAPDTVELKIIETAPNFKGDTSSGGKKPAKLESGVSVLVPYHILEGDVIKVNTVDGVYLEKVKK